MGHADSGAPSMQVAAAPSFDVARVRGLYLTVGAGTAYLDGPLGALQPESVTRAIVATLRSSPAQPGGGTARSQRSAAAVAAARSAFADLVGGEAESVLLGSTLTALQLHLSESLTADWQLGDQIVLSRLDSDAVLHPWLRVARTSGAVVRWGEVDLETGELPTWQYEHLIGPHTRLVTVPLANPATGAVPDVAAIAELAHAQGALVLVDAGAAAGHRPIDLADLGADLVAVSAAWFGGPTVAALAARPGLLREIDASARPPVPERFESGPLPVELLGGAAAAVEHLAALDESATGTRRARLRISVAAAGAWTDRLWHQLRAGLEELPHVTVLGGAAARVPVVAFTVAGRRPAQVGSFLARRGVSVWTGAADMSELMRAYGTDELGGAVFAGVQPHTTATEVDQLIAGLAALG